MFDANDPVLQEVGAETNPTPAVATPFDDTRSARIVEAIGHRSVFEPKAWRRFELYERGDEVNVLEGHGKSLDDAIRYVQNIFADALDLEADPDYHKPLSAGKVSRQFNDITIWEADRVLAVFRPQADGTALVTRFDS